MIETLIKCKQCGEVLPISSYRQYYHGDGHYKVCRNCEKVNSRAKYLKRKGDKATPAEKNELAKIEQLYEYQRLAGLQPPRHRGELQSAMDELDSLIKKYKQTATDIPEELQAWLNTVLYEEPEYYTDKVYEQLVKKYRPVLGVDPKTLMPIYDDRYADTLSKILERFNDYEDKYYE